MRKSAVGADTKETMVAPPHNTNCKLQIAAFLLLLLFTALAAPSAARAAITPVEPASDDRGIYLLSELGHLVWFRDTVNTGSAEIDAKLTKNIDLSEGGSPSHWTPIGQYKSGDIEDNGYAGSFDGGGFTVSGYIVASADVVSADIDILATGLFGLAGQSADIRGLTVSGVVSVDISGSAKYLCAGGIAGINYGTITNCTHSGDVSAASSRYSNNAGGIAGLNYGTITDCAHSGGVSVSSGNFNYAGGIAGYNDGGTITNNANSGEVTASGGSTYNYAGGIAGYNSYSGTITNNAHSGGGVSASGGSFNNAGGIAGRNDGTITNNTHSGGVSVSSSDSNKAGGITGYNYGGTITNNTHRGGDVSAYGGNSNNAGGIAGDNSYGGTITNNAHRGGVSASGGSDSNAGGIAGYNSGSTITNNAHSGGTVTASGGSDNYAGGIAGYNDLGNISNSCWPAGDLEAVGSGDKGPDAVSADVVSLDAAEMKKVVTTILPAKRTLSVEVGGFAPALTSYPGRADDMAGYLSVSGDIFIASPDIAGISDRWPCTVSGIKPGVTAVSFDIDLRATDFSDKNNLKPLTRSCATGPLCFTAAVGKVPVSGVSLDFTELTLDIGASKTLTAAVKPDNATDKAVVWTSADPAVAAVDESGKVTALSVGTTVVTAKAGEKSAACTVTVARKKTGGSGHGCAAGLGALPMLALVPLWLRRKKR